MVITQKNHGVTYCYLTNFLIGITETFLLGLLRSRMYTSWRTQYFKDPSLFTRSNILFFRYLAFFILQNSGLEKNKSKFLHQLKYFDRSFRIWLRVKISTNRWLNFFFIVILKLETFCWKYWFLFKLTKYCSSKKRKKEWLNFKFRVKFRCKR